MSKNYIEKLQEVLIKNDKEYNSHCAICEFSIDTKTLEIIKIGNDMELDNVTLSDDYNALIVLKDLTEEESKIISDEYDFDKGCPIFKKGDVYLFNSDEWVYYYYNTIKEQNEEEKSIHKVNETLCSFNIFECCQNVLNNCNSNKEIWEKIKKMIDIYFE